MLRYSDLVSLTPNPDTRAPSRSLDIHLTGNMERFMWSFDGEAYSPIRKPIPFSFNERVRVNLINDSMMAHPIHLHGHFFEVVNGHPGHHPRKHTVSVAPGGKVSFDLRLTQKLILQPRAGLNLSAQDVADRELGAGFTDAEVGLRLRYAFKPEFAPYIGVNYETSLGETADHARGRGQSTHETTVVLGVRAWL